MLLEIEKKKHNDTGRLILSGVLDISTVDDFTRSFECFHGIKQLTIDFGQLKFIDSTGIGGIVQVIKSCRELEISLAIINIHDEIYEIFDILGLPEVYGNELFRVTK